MDNSKDKMEKKGSRRSNSKKRLLIFTGVAVILGAVSMYFLGGFSEDDTTDATVEESKLEEYVIEQHQGDASIDRVVYGQYSFEDVESEVYVIDFSKENDLADTEDYSGIVEFDESQLTYNFANGKVSKDSPRQDLFTREVRVYTYEDTDLPDAYYNMFYNDVGELDVDLGYFVGDIEYAVAYEQIDESGLNQIATWYVQPNTYPHVQIISRYSMLDENTYGISEEFIEIDGVEYIRYDIYNNNK